MALMLWILRSKPPSPIELGETFAFMGSERPLNMKRSSKPFSPLDRFLDSINPVHDVVLINCTNPHSFHTQRKIFNKSVFHPHSFHTWRKIWHGSDKIKAAKCQLFIWIKLYSLYKVSDWIRQVFLSCRGIE